MYYKLRLKDYILFVLIGIVAGLASIAFMIAIDICKSLLLGLTPIKQPKPMGELKIVEISLPFQLPIWFILVIPTLGGLLCGLLVYKLAPEAEGHGTDEVIRAYHYESACMRARVPIVKLVASAITIGSGGSAGREGPIVQISAGLASILSEEFSLGEMERRALYLSGVAAGISSMFRAPIGGILFSMEFLYKKDYESWTLIPATISSFTAYLTFMAIVGEKTIFRTPHYTLVAYELPLFALMGAIVGLIAKAYVKFFWLTRDKMNELVSKFGLPNYVKPAIGGFLVGLVGLFVPQSLSVGYGYLQLALCGVLTFEIMLLIVVGKILTTSFTLGSGGSGGVFGPSIVIGGMLGGVLGYVFKSFFGNIAVSEIGVFVLIGMASFFRCSW